MKTVSLVTPPTNPSIYTQAKEVLESDGLVCFPSPSGYKIAANLDAPSAITAMIQAKRRVKNAPALVFIPDVSWVTELTDDISKDAQNLMNSLWPGQLTLLFRPSKNLNPRVRKLLTKAKGWLGVRIPCDEVSQSIIKAFGRPLVVSSANLSRKHGERSVAQVRKNFGRTVELLIDTGDIPEGTKSTLVDLTQARPSIVRAGAISDETIHQALTG